MKEKKYFWLKFKDGFFGEKEIKKLRKIAGGDTYTIIYLKMQLQSIKNGGKLFFEGLEDTFAEELSLVLDEEVENIEVTLSYLYKCKLIEELSNEEYLLPKVCGCIGSEGSSADRVRKHRENLIQIKDEVKKLSKIPYIENYQDQKLYDGNYYTVLKRDNMRCVSCGCDENLNIHHIIGNKKELKESRNKSCLITLCRKCHSNEHANPHSILTDDILKNIDFNFELYHLIDGISNNTGQKKLEYSVTCNTEVTELKHLVTKCNTEKRREELDIELDIELEEEEEKNKNKKSTTSPEKTYQDNIGLLTPHIAERIQKLIEDGIDTDLISRYIQIAVERNKRSWTYIEKVALGNLELNIKTLEQYESMCLERENSKNKKSKLEMEMEQWK